MREPRKVAPDGNLWNNEHRPLNWGHLRDYLIPCVLAWNAKTEKFQKLANYKIIEEIEKTPKSLKAWLASNVSKAIPFQDSW